MEFRALRADLVPDIIVFDIEDFGYYIEVIFLRFFDFQIYKLRDFDIEVKVRNVSCHQVLLNARRLSMPLNCNQSDHLPLAVRPKKISLDISLIPRCPKISLNSNKSKDMYYGYQRISLNGYQHGYQRISSFDI